jgi:protein TonB
VIQIKIEWQRDQRKWRNLPLSDRRVLFGALLVSLLLHLSSWLGSGYVPQRTAADNATKVKFRDLTSAEKQKMRALQKDATDAKRIIETRQRETAPPVTASSLGALDHQAEKETKLAKRMMNNSKAMEAAPKAGEQKKAAALAARPPSPQTIQKITTGPGTLNFSQKNNTDKPRNNYEKLLPDKSNDVFAAPNGGYMEHIDANVAEGDRIDMNTTSFRYLSYFTGLRKQIELVWVYPTDAVQRGLQGAVQLEMTIEKDGKVSKARVIESSGYQTLDDNMLKTIKMASPFAPLPKGWGKDRLVVTGSFHYLLSYSSH